jgi:phosphatidylserine/phosphatidylglycerophosphate/cardiolipin synthase-like enzyme
MNSGQFNADVEYCFPRNGKKSDKILIDKIISSKNSLDIAIFTFTDINILKAIINAENRGVKVRIITDKIMSITPLQYIFLKKIKKAGAAVIKKNTHKGFMHLKITIIDKNIVTTASANFYKIVTV